MFWVRCLELLLDLGVRAVGKVLPDIPNVADLTHGLKSEGDASQSQKLLYILDHSDMGFFHLAYIPCLTEILVERW